MYLGNRAVDLGIGLWDPEQLSDYFVVLLNDFSGHFGFAILDGINADDVLVTFSLDHVRPYTLA